MSLTDDLPPLLHTPPGTYRHYKGMLYQVIDTLLQKNSAPST